MRSVEEIKAAIETINANKELTYWYREDVTNVLYWVLGEEEDFDGLKSIND